ncbi:MAG: shikimate kinase, partial [Oscillospiraceae bacterium]
MAKRFGLIGENIGYSHSKSIHKMLADYDYDILSIRPQELESVVHSSQYDGFNVTIPFKKEVMRFCDELSDTAQKIGSVNTLRKRKDGTMFGD